MSQRRVTVRAETGHAPDWPRIEAATAPVEPPFAAVDLTAFDANAADLLQRAAGKPVRLATKSVRCRELLRRVLAVDGFHGVLAYTLAEAMWLAEEVHDVVVAYPTADRAALRELATDERAASRVALMVDSIDHLDLVDSVAPPGRRPTLRVCLDLDASLRAFGIHVGARRSPVHEPERAAVLARQIASRPGYRLAGVMSYEAQVAGVPDRPPGRPVRGVLVSGLQRWSLAELRERRGAAVAAVRAVAPLEFVNGGGTGSLDRTARDDAVTEIAAGSGLYGPALFDGYRSFSPRPAGVFALPVVRRPAPGMVTVAGGGWVASGPAGRDRLPVPVHPSGLRLTGAEGAGEVQTPVVGAAADRLAVGDRVWFRHAKAGELCEHVGALHLVDAGGGDAPAPTYRGEGRAFL
ncbi:MAG: amino acid deaminase/aldolase [Streptosporangiaceae bacterium]